MTFSELKEQLIQIMGQIETHNELRIIHKLYRKRWYEIDKESLKQFKKGDFIKWYKKKKVQWGIIVKMPERKRGYAEAISIKGTEWKLGGSIIEKVVDSKRILKIIAQLKVHGVEIK